MHRKIDHYVGSDEEYIRYLEHTVQKLRQRCRADYPATSLNTQSASASSTLENPTHAAQPEDITASNNGRQPETQSRWQPLQIIQWDPIGTNSQPKQSHTGCPFWEKAAKTLVERTPDAKNWWVTIRNMGIYEAMRSGDAAKFLLVPNCQAPQTATIANTTSDATATDRDSRLLDHITAYAQAAIRKETVASVAIRLVNFQKFLILCACAVLLKTGANKERVLEAVKICFGDSSEEHCLRLVQTSVYLNKLIDTLNVHGWAHHASELLLVWNKAPVYYYSLARAPKESLEYLRDALSNAAPPPGGGAGFENEGTPFFVPSLVESILGKEIS